MQKYALSALISSIVALAMQSNASAQVTPQGAIGQLGTVQQQDLDSAKRLENIIILISMKAMLLISYISLVTINL